MTEVATKKERAKRTPRNLESIIKGALSLELPDRVRLRDELNASIKEEVESLKSKAEVAASLANGTK